MTLPDLMIFDDGQGQFGPLTHLRPVFRLRTGSMNNRVRLEAVLGRSARALCVQQNHVQITRERETDNVAINEPTGAAMLCVNGRYSQSFSGQDLNELAQGHALVQSDSQIVAVHLEASQVQAFITSGCLVLPGAMSTQSVENGLLIDRPWHLHDQLDAVLRFDLSRYDTAIASSAQVHPTAVLDERSGRIVIDQGAIVGPLAVLVGPCYVGHHTEIKSHTNLRPHTSIADYCKMGGEVSASIIHDNTNKAHAGYLGNAIVGSWCNLGADTTVSNLKNTYGQIRTQLEPDALAQPTGRMFMGPIVSDFVRTAIGSRLLTGSCIGVGCCLALSGFAPKFAADLGFYTDAGQQAYDLDRLVESVNRAMARRDASLSSGMIAQLRRLAQV